MHTGKISKIIIRYSCHLIDWFNFSLHHPYAKKVQVMSTSSSTHKSLFTLATTFCNSPFSVSSDMLDMYLCTMKVNPFIAFQFVSKYFFIQHRILFCIPQSLQSLIFSVGQWEAGDGQNWPMRSWEHITWPEGHRAELTHSNFVDLCIIVSNSQSGACICVRWPIRGQYLLSRMQSVLTSLFGSVSGPRCVKHSIAIVCHPDSVLCHIYNSNCHINRINSVTLSMNPSVKMLSKHWNMNGTR